MNMHKNTRLTPYHREEIWRLYTKEKVTVTYLAQRFNVSRPTIYKALRLSRLGYLSHRLALMSALKPSNTVLKGL